jgi:quercetin dioxygenase-like cupin family protein
MTTQNIPIEQLVIELSKNQKYQTTAVLENEIKGIHIEHTVLAANSTLLDHSKDGYKSLYLFFKGNGHIHTANKNYTVLPETIFLPNILNQITINAGDNTLEYLKITSKLSNEDLKDLNEFPTENTQQVYFTKFEDCQSYTEPIKSPNTISRTILPNKIIPRIAMGTVKTKGPDKVGEHKHPMLEQLFLGLSENKCTVYADGAQQQLTAYSLLHIPLGSTHSVSVDEGETLYYVWMDFFLNKEGEEWLKTHIVDND